MSDHMTVVDFTLVLFSVILHFELFKRSDDCRLVKFVNLFCGIGLHFYGNRNLGKNFNVQVPITTFILYRWLIPQCACSSKE